MTPAVQRISVIDSHTGGEPTRVVISGGPDLGKGSMADRRAILRDRGPLAAAPRGCARHLELAVARDKLAFVMSERSASVWTGDFRPQ